MMRASARRPRSVSQESEEEGEEEGEEESEEEGEESESESKEEHTLESGDSDFWEHARNEALRSRTRTTTRTLCAPPAPPLRDHSSHVQVLPHAQSKPAHKGWPLTAGSLDWFAREVASSVTDYAGTRLPGDKTRRAPSLSRTRTTAASGVHWISAYGHLYYISMRWYLV